MNSANESEPEASEAAEPEADSRAPASSTEAEATLDDTNSPDEEDGVLPRAVVIQRQIDAANGRLSIRSPSCW